MEQYPPSDKTATEENTLSWLVLIVSGACEAVWANALAQSKGFKKPVPVIVFLGGLVISMGGLAYAMLELPPGTAYAVWVAVGAVLTCAWAMITGAEKATAQKLGLILTLVACVVGLKVVSGA